MKPWKEFQNEIKSQYPDFKSLPLITRLKIRMFYEPSICVDTISDVGGREKQSQSYKIYSYEGRLYFYKFGW